MKLWLIQQNANNGYGTYDSAIVAAESESEARATEVGSKYSWAKVDDVTAQYLGEAKDGTNAGLILASFNAG